MRWLFACAVGEGRTKNGVDLGRALEAQGERVAFFDIDARPVLAAVFPKAELRDKAAFYLTHHGARERLTHRTSGA